MREVKVKVYKFNELAKEVREELVEAIRSQMDIGESVLEFLNEELANTGLKGVTVENFSIGDEENEDFIVLDGALTESLSRWERHSEYGQHINKISSAFLDENDVSEENALGLSVFWKDDADEELVDEITGFIDEEITKIAENLIDSAKKHVEKLTSDETIISTLEDQEFFENGSHFEEQM